MSQAPWIVERTQSRRFPFRISIEQGGRLLFAARTQSAWPGPGQQIFCLRERGLSPWFFATTTFGRTPGARAVALGLRRGVVPL